MNSQDTPRGSHRQGATVSSSLPSRVPTPSSSSFFGLSQSNYKRHFPSCLSCNGEDTPVDRDSTGDGANLKLLFFHGNFIDGKICNYCCFGDYERPEGVLLIPSEDPEATGPFYSGRGGIKVDGPKLYNSVARRFLQRLLNLEDKMLVESLGDQLQETLGLTGHRKSEREAHIFAMQQRMRKGTQTKDDFTLLGCWGYVRAKFGSRARLSFNTIFQHVIELLPSQPPPALGSCCPSQDSCLEVCSFGGGPGNDIFGAMAAFELAAACADDCMSRADSIRNNLRITYRVFEWIDVWKPIVDAVSVLTNRPIHYTHADIQQPLEDHAANGEVQRLVAESKASFLFVFSFVALESLFCPQLVDGKSVFTDNLLQGLLDHFFKMDRGSTETSALQTAASTARTQKVAFLVLDAGTGKSQERLSGSLMAIQRFIGAGKSEGRFEDGLVCEVLQPDPKNLALLIHVPAVQT